MISRQPLDASDFVMSRSWEERRPIQVRLSKAAGIILAFCFVTASVASAQTVTTLNSFPYANGGPSGVVERSDGNFYGMTEGGWGIDDCGESSGLSCGTVFEVTGGGALTTLYTFNITNGADPAGGVVEGTDGNFYGTTSQGGSGSGCLYNGPCGTVFKITPEGSLTTLYNFSAGSNGANPGAGLVQGTDGDFYGTTGNNGVVAPPSGCCGTIFKITASGALTTLYGFSGSDGSMPASALVQGIDGNFYGTTSKGGAYSNGTVFSITPTGTLVPLHSFCAQISPCPDGLNPGDLVQGTDGNFYGTTYGGGASAVGGGTVFEITTTGTFTTLYSFCSLTNCTDGSSPVGTIIQGSDGNFYGTTAYGGRGVCGDSGCGTIFKITPSGNLTTLYNFCSQANCADGNTPETALLQAADRVLYGTTTQGGANNGGTFFSLSVGLSGMTASNTVVNLAPSSTTAGSNGPVVMTATVSPASGSGTPTGTVAFSNGSDYVGTASLSGGVATYDYNPGSLSANAYPITAVYSGDSTFAGSTSPAQTLTVVVASAPNPDYQLSVNPSALNIMVGQSGKAVFTVTPENGFDTQVSFACSGLPAGAICTFDPANVTPSNSNPVTSTLTVSTTAASATMREPKPFSLWPIYAFLVPSAGMLFGKATRWRRSLRGSRFLHAAALLLMFAALTHAVAAARPQALSLRLKLALLQSLPRLAGPVRSTIQQT